MALSWTTDREFITFQVGTRLDAKKQNIFCEFLVECIGKRDVSLKKSKHGENGGGVILGDLCVFYVASPFLKIYFLNEKSFGDIFSQRCNFKESDTREIPFADSKLPTCFPPSQSLPFFAFPVIFFHAFFSTVCREKV